MLSAIRLVTLIHPHPDLHVYVAVDMLAWLVKQGRLCDDGIVQVLCIHVA